MIAARFCDDFFKKSLFYNVISVITAVSAATVTPTTAQPLSEEAAQVTGVSFVRAFVGMCGQNAGNYDLIIDAATALGFHDLPENMKSLFAPQNPNADFVGFLATEVEGAPFILGLSKAEVDGVSNTSCVVANPYIKTESVVSALEEIVGVGPTISDEKGMGQRLRVWDTHSWAEGSFISLTDAEPMGYGGATLGMTAPTVE